MVRVKITPINPGTTLYCVIPSGLKRRWTRTSKGTGSPASEASGPVNSFCTTDCEMPVIAANAFAAALGSVASASISSAGRSW